MLSVTKIFRFEAAHAISDHRGLCRHIHGHSYELHVTVTADRLNSAGMIVDFGVLKTAVENAVVKEFDHALILNRTGHLAAAHNTEGSRLVLLDGEPTAEHLLSIIAARMHPVLPDPVKLLRLKLWETATSYAEWERG